MFGDEMFIVKRLFLVCLMVVCGRVFGADVILNEFNAVDELEFLNGGTAIADLDGTKAGDSYFGRVVGNGGDWLELVVITDHLDMRNWKLDIYSDGLFDETLDFSNHSIWSNLRSGTIITVSEDVPSDISYNPAAGDWWINVRANNDEDGLYIEASNFSVNSSNWQLTIKNAAGVVKFGPAGEGIVPASGLGNTEIFKLEANPSAAITAVSPDYDDSDSLSTFGAANEWGRQNLGLLRGNVTVPSSTLTLLSPNGSEELMGGSIYDIMWTNTGVVDGVLIEFSTDYGYTWTAVYPPNTGNSGLYSWLVPLVDSQHCVVRVRNAADAGVYDASDEAFTTYECEVEGDMTGDCMVNMLDFAIMANWWLECGNPYDAECSQ